MDNSPTVNIGVGVTPDVAGPLGLIDKEFDASRARMERPVKGRIEIDTSSIAIAKREMAEVQRMALRPSTAITIPKSRADAIPLARPVTGPVTSAQAVRDEQAIEDIMAGIVAGMEQRQQVEQEITRHAKLELEGRRRLGLGSTLGRDVRKEDIELGDLEGPRNRPRFDERETLIRTAEAQLIKSIDDEAKAREANAEAAKIEREARQRQGLPDKPLREKVTGRDARDRDTRATQKRMQRDRAADVDSGSYGSGFSNPDGTPTSRPASKGRPGGGGGRGDPLKTLANVVPGLGPSGVILLGLNAAAKAPEVIKEYGQNRQTYSRTESLALGVGNALGLTGVAQGLNTSIRRGFNAVLAPGANAREDREAEARDFKEQLRQKKDEQRARDDAVVNPMVGQNSAAVLAGNRAAAAAGVRNSFERQNMELSNSTADENARLDAQLREARTNKVSGPEMERLEKSVAEARKANDAKYAAERARLNEDEDRKNAQVERQGIIDRGERQSSLRQEIYEAQGQSVSAAIERINQQSETAIASAKSRVQDLLDQGFLESSAEIRNARQGVTDAEGAKAARRQYVIPEQLRQAAIRNGQALAEGLQQQAGQGDVEAAVRASKIILDQQLAERKRTLENIVKQKTTSKEQADEAKRQLDALKGFGNRQAKLNEDQLRSQENQRQAGIQSDINSGRIEELRRRADRTGNRGLGLQADAYELAEQFNQKKLALEGRLAQGGLSADQQKDIKDELASIPDRLKGAIGDLTRVRVSAEAFGRGATTAAQDAGGFTGLAQSAKENVQGRIAKLNEDMAKNLSKLVKIFEEASKNGQTKVIQLGAV